MIYTLEHTNMKYLKKQTWVALKKSPDEKRSRNIFTFWCFFIKICIFNLKMQKKHDKNTFT